MKNHNWKNQTKSAHLIYHMIAPLRFLVMENNFFYPFNFIHFSKTLTYTCFHHTALWYES